MGRQSGTPTIASMMQTFVTAASRHTARRSIVYASSAELYDGGEGDTTLGSQRQHLTGSVEHQGDRAADEADVVVRALRSRLETLEADEQLARLITLRPQAGNLTHASAWRRIHHIRRAKYTE